MSNAINAIAFADIFKSSFLENITEFSLLDTVIGLAFSLIVGLFIYVIYRKTLTGVMYSSGLAFTLVGMTSVTALVIMAVTSNVVLSLGMVGALSIVRFRAAIKEPAEIVFLFWSLAAGIVVGAGMIPLALVGSVIIGLLLLLLANRKQRDDPYMLVLNCGSEDCEKKALALIQATGSPMKIKAKTVTSAGIELSIQIRPKDPSMSFVNSLSALQDMRSAALVSYNGEYMS